MILQADSDPGKDGVGPLLSWKCPGGVCGEFRRGCLLGVSLYCVSLCPIQLCGDLAGLLCPLGRAREGKWRVMIPAVHVLDADANTA